MNLQTYRRPLIGITSAIIVYALLGFFLAPWLINNAATSAVRDNLGVELSLRKVSVNLFVLSLQIDGLELDEPGGDPFQQAANKCRENNALIGIFRVM